MTRGGWRTVSYAPDSPTRRVSMSVGVLLLARHIDTRSGHNHDLERVDRLGRAILLF